MARFRRPESRRAEGERLVRLRDALGLSQRELARELQVAPAAVALWERGQRTVPGPALRLLCLYEAAAGLAPDDASPDWLAGSPLSRGLELTTSALELGAHWAWLGLRGMLAAEHERDAIRARVQQAAARRLVQRLGKMKGLSMKLVQMLSYVDPRTFAEAPAIVARLQAAAPAMAPSLVNAVMLASFGKLPHELFAEWIPEPLAVGSIGQVHRARLRDGRSVAVKVQHPGIRQTLEADLANFDVLDSAYCILFAGQRRGVIARELADRVAEECDYRVEAHSQEAFRQAFAARPEMVVPRTVPELSGARVLTSELLGGVPFERFCREASPAERRRAGEAIFDFTMESLCVHGLFNGDPHPGNFLFQPRAVAFLDFGFVRRLSPAFVASWRATLRWTLGAGSPDELRALAADMGLVADARRFDFAYHLEMARLLCEPWQKRGRYRFDHDYLRRLWRALFVHNPNRAVTDVSSELFFLSRLPFGIYSILAQIGAESDWRARVEAVVARA
jgi:predicted unusual protein kinase regulating ubiquinone biosynthesis (AarF/ABC1/UbiB family)